jgi:hypothetical protein
MAFGTFLIFVKPTFAACPGETGLATASSRIEEVDGLLETVQTPKLKLGAAAGVFGWRVRSTWTWSIPAR